MRPMDAQNRLPEVAADQFALDRTLKHLRKLRWIGRESEAEKILAVLDVRRRQKAPSRQRRANRSVSLSRHTSSSPITDKSDEIFVAPEQSVPHHCRQPHGLSQGGDVRFVPTQSCQAASPPTPGLACPGGFPRAARDPFRVASRNVPRREKKQVSGLRAHEPGDSPNPGETGEATD